MKKIALVSLFALLLCSASFAVPYKINYQGLLKDSSGSPYTGSFDMTFAIYSGATGGTPSTALWSETQSGVSVEAGLYNVRLGSVNSITPEVFDGSTRYLGVTVAPDAEMEPRIPIISVPYAFRAEQVGNFGAEDLVRLGTTSAQSTTQPFGLAVETSQIAGIGVGGTNNSTNGIGVWGYSEGNAGIGVMGKASADNGRGVFGQSINDTSGYGGQFRALGSSGIGVKGQATSTSVTGTRYGVLGESMHENGIGVYGSTEAGIGVYGVSLSGVAVYVDEILQLKPTGSSTDHPSISAAAGMVYYNQDTKKLYVHNGSIWKALAYVATSITPTGTSDPSGETGQISYDDNYIYVKTSAGWKRAALSSW